MKNRWNAALFEQFTDDLLAQRVYSSQLLGQEPQLVLHGGGNTSVKITEENAFGEKEDILYVKGSGWDLATIQAAGFAPVKLEILLRLAQFQHLSDAEMVRLQRTAMTQPDAPNPSVEAILHAIIPFRFVDHSHADAVVTISNTANGLERIRSIYQERVLIIPYVMPGFELAKLVYEQTKNIDWDTVDALILMNHGVFTFHQQAAQSYNNMIQIVQQAEDYLEDLNIKELAAHQTGQQAVHTLVGLRKKVSQIRGQALIARMDCQGSTFSFSKLPNLSSIANRGPLTPDHIIRTKRNPLLLDQAIDEALEAYSKDYQAYFDEHHLKGLQCLDKAPRWALIPSKGAVYFGRTVQEMQIVTAIAQHTMRAIYKAEQMGGWTALSRRDLFNMEYWELEQLKLKKNKESAPMQGKIALVTGAASGIGKATVIALSKAGAVVIALDINPDIMHTFSSPQVKSFVCDLCDEKAMMACLLEGVAHWGGLDYLVLNAGVFPPSSKIQDMPLSIWDKSLEVNLSAPQRLLQHCQTFLEQGIEPAVVLVGSKNVPAPGQGAAAYSVAKAALTQLGRIAALEMGEKGIRVNILHPNAVYDTAIWTQSVLESRAKHYGLSVADYKSNNVLNVSITSEDVAQTIVTMLGPAFSKITGAQLPLDGGNTRVI